MIMVTKPVRNMNPVEPLGHKPTAMRTTDTAAPALARSSAVTHLIGLGVAGAANGRRKRLFHRPAQAKAHADVVRLDASRSRPLRNALSFPGMGQLNGMSGPVGILRRLSGPSAIPGLVTLGTILSVQRHGSIWAFAHIGQEIRVVVPALADPYSDSAVVLEVSGLRVVAALHHGFPAHVRQGAVATVFDVSVGVHSTDYEQQLDILQDLFASGNSYFGLMGQSTHGHTARAEIANVLRGRGHAVKGDLTKIYRRAV